MALTRVSPSLFATSNNITSVTVGGSANTISLTFDASGVITSASNNAVSVANTAITGNIISSQITSVANTQITGTISVANTAITGNIISSQITPNPTLYGNVSVTGVIGVGGATPSTSGSGITFPATQSASSNANTLDDYEEGSFTPTITGDGFTRTYNGSYTAGRYTKIGRSVTIEVAMYVPTQTGTYNGQAPEFNLPFPSSGFVSAQHWSLTVLRLATVPAAMLAQVPVLNAMSDTSALRGYLSRTASGTSTSNAWDMTTMGTDYQIGYTLTYITST